MIMVNCSLIFLLKYFERVKQDVNESNGLANIEIILDLNEISKKESK